MHISDTIMIEGALAATTPFTIRDTMRDPNNPVKKLAGYMKVLDEELGANEILPIKMEELGYDDVALNSYGTGVITAIIRDTLYSINVSGKVLYASGYTSIPSATKTIRTYVMRKKSDPPPAVIESVMEQIKCYPNPVSSNLTITNLKNTTVELYNIVGQRIVQQENVSGDISIDMKEYPEGVYFVKIQNGKAVRTEKIKLVK